MRQLVRHLARHFVLALAAAASVVAPAIGQAQSFPTKPVTIVVPYPPGGTTDTLARVLAESMGKFLGQTVVIDNRAGASGIVGTKLVAGAPADGYTLLMPNNALAISPYLTKDANWTVKTFAPVSMLTLQPMVLITHPSVPAKTVDEFIAYAKANLGKVNFATAGPASFGHLATEQFMRRAGIKMTHIPYKGVGPVTQALLTGEVQVLISTSSAQLGEFVKEGKLRLLGATSLEPSPMAPGAEPIAKTLPKFEVEIWFSLVAPAATPKDVVTRLNDAVVKALQVPEVKAKFALSGAAAAPTTPEQFGKRIADEDTNWSRVIREANIKLE